MISELNSALLAQISHHYQIDQIVAPPRVIPGGKIHQVWQLQTQRQAYALKYLCIDITPLTLSRYRQTQRIAAEFQRHTIPSIVAKQRNEDPLCVLENSCFMLFDWIAGQKVFPHAVTTQHAAKLGSLLANMHRLKLSPSDLDIAALNDQFYAQSFCPHQWDRLVRAAVGKELQQADKLTALLPTLVAVAEQAEQATHRLRDQRVIAHRDASPNNVIWRHDQSPIIIDWELAGLIHPTVDLLGAAFDWSIVSADNIDTQRFQSLSAAYRIAQGSIVEVETAFYALMGIWLSWLEFNLQRFVQANTPAERNLGEREVLHTLGAFVTIYPQRYSWLKRLM